MKSTNRIMLFILALALTLFAASAVMADDGHKKCGKKASSCTEASKGDCAKHTKAHAACGEKTACTVKGCEKSCCTEACAAACAEAGCCKEGKCVPADCKADCCKDGKCAEKCAVKCAEKCATDCAHHGAKKGCGSTCSGHAKKSN